MQVNEKIGFDDRLLMLCMIPVSAFIIPFVFFGIRFHKPPYLSWQVYLTTLIITSAIWLGNRFILTRARSWYPQFNQTRKRIVRQSLVMLLYTLAATNLLGYFLHDFCQLQDVQGRGITAGDIVINSNNAAIFSSLTVIAIYESVYFMSQLRQSVEEKELLRRESLQAQLNALRTQVNPHFLFNNLNALVSVIPESPEQAVQFVQQLSKVYRHILEVKEERSIPLKDELSVLHAYAFLLQTRFGNNLSIHINVPEEKLRKQVVPLSLQLLMENAIKHNIVSSTRPLTIDVFTSNGSLVVKNNLQKKNQVLESTGIGLDNIRNRYRLLSETAVEVKEDGQSFTVSIPLI